jgi:hypothetical protein
MVRGEAAMGNTLARRITFTHHAHETLLPD